MRAHSSFRFICLSVSLVCGAQLLPAGEGVHSAPVLDKSFFPGSPLEISGDVSVVEECSDSSFRYSFRGPVHARNISSKQIMTLLAKVNPVGSYGQGGDGTVQYELFFSPGLIKPGARFSLMRYGGRTTRVIEPRGQTCHPTESPRVEVTVLYTELEDGTTYGGAALAEELLRNRRITWWILRQLLRTYEHSGEAEFRKDLGEAAALSWGFAILRQLHAALEKQGPTNLVEDIRTKLRLAEAHQGVLDAAAARHQASDLILPPK